MNERLDDWLYAHPRAVAWFLILGHVLMFVRFGLWAGVASCVLAFAWLIWARMFQVAEEEAGRG